MTLRHIFSVFLLYPKAYVLVSLFFFFVVSCMFVVMTLVWRVLIVSPPLKSLREYHSPLTWLSCIIDLICHRLYLEKMQVAICAVLVIVLFQCVSFVSNDMAKHCPSCALLFHKLDVAHMWDLTNIPVCGYSSFHAQIGHMPVEPEVSLMASPFYKNSIMWPKDQLF